jgi:methionine-rich copper-binding protein CopC
VNRPQRASWLARPGLWIGLLWLVGAASPALAHASLISAEPAPGAVVSPAVAEIRLAFDERLGPASAVRVFAAGFRAVPDVTSQVEGNILRAALARPLSPGVYTVQWEAASPDGHSTQGSYQFEVSGSPAAWPGDFFPLGYAAGAAILGMIWWRFYRRQRGIRKGVRLDQ